MTRSEQIIQSLGLKPHPEGGYYKETYRSVGQIPDGAILGIEGERSYSTAIYFLLTRTVFSAFHKIKSDEMWHHYDGAAIELHMISPEGEYTKVVIGKDFSNGEHPQYVVPAGYWFGSRVKGDAEFSLLGCTVSPGFDFHDFVLAKEEELTSIFPKHTKIISELTHR